MLKTAEQRGTQAHVEISPDVKRSAVLEAMNRRRVLGATFVTLALAAFAAICLSALAPRSGAAGTSTGSYWIVLGSDRGGKGQRAYSVRPDGSHLAPLLARPGALNPWSLSADGSTIAYVDDQGAIYVSRADGADLRRLAGDSFHPALSRDGKLLAFDDDNNAMWIVGTDGHGRRRLTSGHTDLVPDWSPDGKALVFERDISDDVQAIVVQPVHGKQRVLARGSAVSDPKWSPDGSRIAYAANITDTGLGPLYVIQPNGQHRRQVARDVADFTWSPDGARLAFIFGERGDAAVVGVGGQGLRQLGLRNLRVSNATWSPDGRRLALSAGDPSQIWAVGLDGRGLRRVTSVGHNHAVGWTRFAPVLQPVAPVPPTKLVAGTHTLVTHAPVEDIAADGSRVAVIAGTTKTDCHHVIVWTEGMKSVRRFPEGPAPCVGADADDRIGPVALSGARVAWLWTSGTGNFMETHVNTATLAHPTSLLGEVGEASADRSNDVGTFAGPPVGHGGLLAFTVERSCDSDPNAQPGDACPKGHKTGDIVAATLYRIGGPGSCLSPCTVAKADGPLSVLAVDAGRIAVRTTRGINLLSASGGVLRSFMVTADAAALSGKRLAVRTENAFEVYDTDSGKLTASFPAPTSLRLQDLDGDILVTASGGVITVRRLSDGRTTTINAGGVARAQLEQPGLFVAGAQRLTFTPMQDVLRRLGG